MSSWWGFSNVRFFITTVFLADGEIGEVGVVVVDVGVELFVVWDVVVVDEVVVEVIGMVNVLEVVELADVVVDVVDVLGLEVVVVDMGFKVVVEVVDGVVAAMDERN